MIINSLVKAYDRLESDENCEITRDGYCFEVVKNYIVIDKDGNLKEIIENSSTKREKLPENSKKSTTEAWLLIDKPDYLLGIAYDKESKEFKEALDLNNSKKKEKGEDYITKFSLFKQKNLDFLSNVNSDMAKAVTCFLNKWEPNQEKDNSAFFTIDNDNDKKPRKIDDLCGFVLDSVLHKSYEDKEILKKWEEYLAFKPNTDNELAQCSITGKLSTIAKNHKEIKLSGPQGKSAYLISVDKATTSYQSYNKQECFNSPISDDVMNKYTATLNYFYRKGSKNKIRFGNDTMIFWAECDGNDYQDDMFALMGIMPTMSDESVKEEEIYETAKQLKEAIKTDFNTDDDVRFHIMLVSPNSARLTLRRYYTSTFGHLRCSVEQHHKDMQMINSKGEEKQFPLRHLLDATISSVITKKRDENINPNFSRALFESIFNCTNYPTAIFAEMIARLKTDNSGADEPMKKAQIINLTAKRVAYLKAYLVRNNRLKRKKEDITMSLNLQNKDEAYLLGRLFAVMEKAQQEAIPGANSTIKDRFFASACSTPAAVFPTLLMGYQNHIAKLEKGRGRYEKIICEIFASKDGASFPKQLDLDGQGRFIIGYYQQNIDLWTKQSNASVRQADDKTEN